MVVCRAKLSPKVCAKASMAITFKQQEAVADKLIDGTYRGTDDLQEQLFTFAKRYARFGAMRDAMKLNKMNQYEETIKACRTFKFDPIYDNYIRPKHAMMAKILKKQWAAKAEAKKIRQKQQVRIQKERPRL